MTCSESCVPWRNRLLFGAEAWKGIKSTGDTSATHSPRHIVSVPRNRSRLPCEIRRKSRISKSGKGRGAASTWSRKANHSGLVTMLLHQPLSPPDSPPIPTNEIDEGSKANRRNVIAALAGGRCDELVAWACGKRPRWYDWREELNRAPLKTSGDFNVELRNWDLVSNGR